MDSILGRPSTKLCKNEEKLDIKYEEPELIAGCIDF